MGMITDEHMEWATVHRMREMLVNVHDDYKVTHTYALFTTILCWVMQRVRAGGQDHINQRARALFQELQNEQISDAPWSIWTDAGHHHHDARRFRPVGPFPEFQGFDAARFLTALRNATAHGDARNIRPFNRDEILVGHQFRCTEKDRRRVTWQGTIILERADMRRIGIALADRFCAALSGDQHERERPYFEGEAGRIREEAA
jgi:hypothetical protein